MEKQYKRTSKSVPQDVRNKISQSMKRKGITRDSETKQAISKGMKTYWNTPSNFPDDIRHEGTGEGWIETGDVV